MELASYIYAAWAYEQANQGVSDGNLLTCDELCAGEDHVNKHDWTFAALKQQAYLLSAIAFTSLGGGWNVSPAMAAYGLEPSVNTAPWCNNLYLCDTSYMLEVQTLLARRGFEVGAIDGVYGRYTKQAVVAFQKTQTNLVADGIPGEKTLTLLRNFSARQPLAPQPSVQTPNQVIISDRPNQPLNQTPNQTPNQTVLIVRSGNSQGTNSQVINSQQPELSEIGNLQMLLKQRGFYQGEIDGQLGQSTTNAIAKAQQAYGLSQDGFAGPLTIRSLLAGGSNVALSQPAIDRPPKPEDVLQFQMFLRDRGFYNGDLNGIYNIETKASILKAQIAYGIKPSGDLSADLLTALKSQNDAQNIAQNIPQNAPQNVPQNIPSTSTTPTPNIQSVQPIPNSNQTGNSTQATSSSQNALVSPAKNSNSS